MLTVAAFARNPLTPLDDLLYFARDTGLSHVQLAWEQIVRATCAKNESLPKRTADFSPRVSSLTGSVAITYDSRVNATIERLRQEGMKIIGIDAAAFDCLDEITFKKQIDAVRIQMRIAERLGAPHLTQVPQLRQNK